nr:MAG TPA: hypothetical protein [Bacteriophage sp.]DAV37438.1 MAG TPA: hypothetical protein [Caudoviricetes sp.]
MVRITSNGLLSDRTLCIAVLTPLACGTHKATSAS